MDQVLSIKDWMISRSDKQFEFIEFDKHYVQRLSDGFIFKIGDVVGIETGSSLNYKIKEFNLDHKHVILILEYFKYETRVPINNLKATWSKY